jgi:hypothetical protein
LIAAVPGVRIEIRGWGRREGEIFSSSVSGVFDFDFDEIFPAPEYNAPGSLLKQEGVRLKRTNETQHSQSGKKNV